MIFNFFKAFLKLFVYYLSGFFHKNSSVWIFGSTSNLFFDNPKYLFIHVLANCNDVLPVWISGDKKTIDKIRLAGGVAYLRWSIHGIYYSLVGRFWFVGYHANDINYVLSRGCKLVNLWHGNSLKKIEFDIDSGPLSELYQRPNFSDRYIKNAHIFKRPDILISTSNYMSKLSFSSAFRINLDQCLALGYPRLDIIYWTHNEISQWLKKWGSKEQILLLEQLKSYKSVFLYMPTWRDSTPDFLNTIDINLLDVDEKCIKENSILLVKLHPATPIKSKSLFSNFRNIRVLSSDDDVYPILNSVDGLITDYSSIYFDFLLLNRPIYFYPFDFEEYVNSSRGLYFSYEHVTPGFKMTSTKDLISIVSGQIPDLYENERFGLMSKVFDVWDQKSCHRIVEYIKNDSRR